MSSEVRRLDRVYTIRQLSAEFKVTARALRFYEDKGLLSPRREGLTRIYSHRDRVRLTLILWGKRVGLSLSEIREILDLYRADDGGVAQKMRSLTMFRAKVIDLEAQRDELDQIIGDLKQACERLEDLLSDIPPELLPQAADYDSVLRARLDGVHEVAAK